MLQNECAYNVLPFCCILVDRSRCKVQLHLRFAIDPPSQTHIYLLAGVALAAAEADVEVGGRHLGCLLVCLLIYSHTTKTIESAADGYRRSRDVWRKSLKTWGSGTQSSGIMLRTREQGMRGDDIGALGTAG